MKRSVLALYVVIASLLPIGVANAMLPAAAVTAAAPAPGPWMLNWPDIRTLVATEVAAPHRTKVVWASPKNNPFAGTMESIVAAPNGRLAVASNDTTTTRSTLWLSGAGRPPVRLHAAKPGYCVGQPSFSRTGRYLAYVLGRPTEFHDCKANGAYIYDTVTRRTVRLVIPHTLLGAVVYSGFSYDESYVEVGGYNARLKKVVENLHSRAGRSR